MQDRTKLHQYFNDSTQNVLVIPSVISSDSVYTDPLCYQQHCTMHCETWKSTAHIRNTLDVFHRRCIRKLLGLTWQGRITVEKIMKRAAMHDRSEIVRTDKLRLAGRVLRTPVSRSASVALNWHPETDRRLRERPQKSWRLTFSEDLQELKITRRGAKRAASDRNRWMNLVAQCPSWDR